MKARFDKVTEVDEAGIVDAEAVGENEGVNSNGSARLSRSPPNRGVIPRPADFKRVRMLRYEHANNLTSPNRNASLQTDQEADPSRSRFSCGVNGCTRSVSRPFELDYHYRKRVGVRDYHCRFLMCRRAAPNRFTRKDHLKKHLLQVHKTSV